MRRRLGRSALAGVMLLTAGTLLPGLHVAGASQAEWSAAWPMAGHDPQRTNRSPVTGPTHPRLIFTTPLLSGPVVIGADGSVYGWGRAGFQALNTQGRSRWMLPVLGLEGGPPALTPDGLLVVNGLVVTGKGAGRRAGMAVLARTASTGAPRWAIHALPWASTIGGTFYLQNQPIRMGRSVPLSKGAAPLVTADGTLYMPFVGPGSPNAGVEVITPRGQPLRRLAPNVEPAEIAWATDGTLYEMGLQGLIALAPSGARRWTRRLSDASTNPGAILVGMHRIIYVSDGTAVAAYTSAGKLLWRRETGGLVGALAERADGVLLALNTTTLLAVSPKRILLWRRTLGHPPGEALGAMSIVVDGARRAYVGSADGRVRAIGSKGALLWTIAAGGSTNLNDGPSVALGPRGTLVVSGTDGRLRVYR